MLPCLFISPLFLTRIVLLIHDVVEILRYVDLLQVLELERPPVLLSYVVTLR